MAERNLALMVLSVSFTPLSTIGLLMFRRSRSRPGKALYLLMFLAGLPIGVFWFLKVGWILGLPTLYCSILISSYTRREHGAAAEAEVETGLRRIMLLPFDYCLKTASLVMDYPLSLVWSMLTFGFLWPASSLVLRRSRKPSLKVRMVSFLSFIGIVLGLPVGILWFLRVGWLLSLATLPVFSSISSIWRYRRSRPRVELERVEAPARREVELKLEIPSYPCKTIFYLLFSLHILILTLVQMGTSGFLNPDNAYHVLIGKMIGERGYFLWDWVQFAPAGRPHLYPPLFHTIIAIVGRALGGSPWGYIYGNLVASLLILILGLYSAWYVGRKLYGEVGGLVLFILVSGIGLLTLSMAIGLPSALVFILAPLSALWMLEGKDFYSILSATASMYSHVSGLAIPTITLIVSGFLSGRLRKALKIVFLSLAAYAPWLIRLIIFREWFSVPEHDIHIEWNYYLTALTIPGVAISLRTPRRYPVQLGYLSSLIPVFLTYPGRAILQGSYAYSLFATLTIITLIKLLKKHRKKILSTILLITYLFPLGISTPAFEIYLLTHPKTLSKSDWREAEVVALALQNITRQGEVVHFEKPYFGCAVAVFANIRLDSGAWGEVAPKNTGAIIGENVLTIVAKLDVEIPRFFQDFFVASYASGDYWIIRLNPEGSINLSEALPMIIDSCRTAAQLLKSNHTLAVVELKKLELAFASLSLYYVKRDPNLSRTLSEISQGISWLILILTEDWAEDLRTPEKIGEFATMLNQLADNVEVRYRELQVNP